MSVNLARSRGILRRGLPLALAVVFCAAPGAALAADYAVTVSSNQYSPTPLTVTVGDTVTWTNTGGTHNVHFNDGSFVRPPTPTSGMWKESRQFDAVGSFSYYCDRHGPGMSGSVNVQAPGTTLPPGVAPPGSTPSPLLADTVVPKLALRTAKRQRVLRRRGVILRVETDEPATLRARGSVTVPGASRTVRFKSVTAKLDAGVERRVKLTFSRKGLRTVRRALKRSRSLTARITTSVTDRSGNADRAKRRIRLTA